LHSDATPLDEDPAFRLIARAEQYFAGPQAHGQSADALRGSRGVGGAFVGTQDLAEVGSAASSGDAFTALGFPAAASLFIAENDW
jgi:hypothetical protein